MTRMYQPIQTKYWDNVRRKGLLPDEILVELYLVTNQACGPSGAMIAAPSTIAYYTGIPDEKSDSDLFGNMRVETALRGLESKKRIEIFPGGWVWVVGKWEYESTKTEQVQKAVVIELTSAPDSLVQAFFDRYTDTLNPTLTVTLTDRLTVTVPPIKIINKDNNKENNKEHIPGKPGARVKVGPIAEVLKRDQIEYPEIYAFIQELFPDVWTDKPKELKAQADAFRLILYRDSTELMEDVQACLRWAKADIIPGAGHGEWQGWGVQFKSFRGLRRKRDGVSKFEKIWASYQNSLKKPKSHLAALDDRGKFSGTSGRKKI